MRPNTFTSASQIMADLHKNLETFGSVSSSNGQAFNVYGYSFAILRNGYAWDVLSPMGLEQNIDAEDLATAISAIVVELEMEEQGWHFNPDLVQP